MRPMRALAVAILLSTVGPLGCASPPRPPIDEMIRSAESPGDHWRIVEYYREAAADARRQGAEHRRLAGVYGSQHNWGISFADRASDHCQELAASEEERAAHFERLAAEHERIAQQ